MFSSLEKHRGLVQFEAQMDNKTSFTLDEDPVMIEKKKKNRMNEWSLHGYGETLLCIFKRRGLLITSDRSLGGGAGVEHTQSSVVIMVLHHCKGCILMV